MRVLSFQSLFSSKLFISRAGQRSNDVSSFHFQIRFDANNRRHSQKFPEDLISPFLPLRRDSDDTVPYFVSNLCHVNSFCVLTKEMPKGRER